MTRRCAHGFTLVEVMVALSLSVLVVLLAHRVFAAVADGMGRLDRARDALDRRANADRWLIEAFGSLQVGTDSAGSFEGYSDQVTFTTWCLVSPSGFRRMRILLHQSRSTLEATWTTGHVVLADSVTAVAFDYLLEPGANTVWAREWLSPASAPLAIRVRITRPGSRLLVDTLLVGIGGRG